MGSGNPLPNPGTRLRLARELVEEPRASLNNFYNIIFSSLATGANRSQQLTKGTTPYILTLRNTKLPRPSRGGSPLLGNKKRRSPRETTTSEVLNFTANYTKSLSPGGKLSELEHLRSGGLSLAVAFAFLRALCVRTMVVLVGSSGGTTLRNSNFRTLR